MHFNALQERVIRFLEKVELHVTPTQKMHPIQDDTAEHFLDFLLSIPVDQHNKSYHNKSVLYFLTAAGTEDSASILSELFTDPTVASLFISRSDFMSAFLEPIQTGRDINSSILTMMLEQDINHVVLRKLLQNEYFKEKLIEHPHFIETLLLRRPNTNYSNSSAFLWFATSNWCSIFQEFIKNASFFEMLTKHPLFLETFFEFKTDGFFAYWSVFNTLIESEEGCLLLLEILKDKSIHPLFINCPAFFTALLTNTPQENNDNSSAFFMLLTTTTRRLILNYFINDDQFLYKLTQHPLFITALLNRQTTESFTNLSALYLLIEPPNSDRVMTCLFNQEIVTQALISHPDFFNTLFAPLHIGNHCNTSALTWLVDTAMNQLVPVQRFLSDEKVCPLLLSNTAFLPALFASRSEAPHVSAIYFLSEGLEGHRILQKWFSDPDIMAALSTQEYSSQLSLNLLSNPLDKNHFKNYPLLNLLSTATGQAIVQQLFSQKKIKQAIFKRLKLPRHSLFETLIYHEAGLILFNNLTELGRINLLSVNHSISQLFNDPQVKLLITLKLINPELFLLLAATSPLEKDFIEILQYPNVSPWITTTKGRTLQHLIENHPLFDEEAKKSRLNHLKTSMKRYVKNLQSKNLIVHLHKLAPLLNQTQYRPEDLIAPELPAITNPDDSHQQMIDQALIIDFHRHIQWILNEPKLVSYHCAFTALLENKVIANNDDILVILMQIKSICSLMNTYLLNNKTIPTAPSDWESSFGKCIKGVQNTFSEMFIEFSYQPSLSRYLDQVQTDTMATYNRLFGTKESLEVHIPKNAIKAEMGLLVPLPSADIFLRNWSCSQRQWVAQSTMIALNDRNIFVKKLTETLEIELSSFTPKTSTIKRRRQAAATIKLTPDVMSYLLEKHQDYCQSPLFGTSLDIRSFLAFIQDTNLDDDKLETRLVLRPDLASALEKKANLFINKTVFLESSRVIETKEIFFWRFLTTSFKQASNFGYERLWATFLSDCSKAIDGPAFIQKHLLSHQDQLSQINIEKLFYLTEKSYSIFSILLSNPLIIEWLFGFKVLTYQENEEVLFELTQIEPSIPILGSAILTYKKLPRYIPMLLNHPGALIFILGYLQMQPDTFHQELYQSILAYLKDPTSKNLFEYNGLGPLLYEMQNSTSVPASDKKLIVEFLINTCLKQIQIEDSLFLQTASYLIPSINFKTLLFTISQNNNPWIINIINNPDYIIPLSYLLNESRSVKLKKQLDALTKDLEQNFHISTSSDLELLFFRSTNKLDHSENRLKIKSQEDNSEEASKGNDGPQFLL